MASAPTPQRLESVPPPEKQVPEAVVDFVYRTIQRTDAQIQYSNAKASLLITINSLVLTFTLLNAEKLLLMGTTRFPRRVFEMLFLSIGVSGLMSLGLAIWVVAPLFKAHENDGTGTHRASLFYFQDIVSRSVSEYASHVLAARQEELVSDLVRQSHALAAIAVAKFQLIKWSARFFIIGVIGPLLALYLLKATQ